MPLRVLRPPELEAEKVPRKQAPSLELLRLPSSKQLPTAAAWRQADDRMRVKKLNVNRRHKAGEDEAVAADGDSEQRKWVSPTKPQRSVRTGSSSGSSSPTDVQQQQHLGEHSPLYGGSGGVAVMPNATLDVVMHEEDKNPIRNAMIDRIVETLRAMKPHAPEKVLAALPRLAQHMEKTLYKLAKNEAEYCDQSTLRLRIAHIQENNAKRLLAQQQQQPQTPEYNGNATPLKPLPEEQARILFQHLQCWRQKLVNMYGVTPWEILPNPTLAKVALYMPSTEQELAVCGVDNDKISRFGSSLVQELQRLRGPSPSKPVTRPIKAKPGRKPNPGKRGLTEPLAGANKKRKNGEAAPRLAPAAPAPSFNVMPTAPLLPAVDSLPTLLPTVSMIPSGVTGSAGAASNSMTMKQSQFSTSAGSRLSPGPISQQQQQFLTRLQPQQQQQQGSPSPAQENHMHLLVQGAGQLSKQQNVKSVEAYEQEVQSLRWMLHQTQQEKTQLEMEIQRLRTELHGRNGTK